MEETDVLIIGGGPIGLEVAWGLKRAGVPHVHVEAGQIGSTFEWWAPDTKFFSSPERLEICGVPIATRDQGKITGEEYIAYLRGVVRQFDLDVRTYERVVGIEGADGGFVVRTERSTHGVGGKEELEEGTEASAAGRTSTRHGGTKREGFEYKAGRVVLAIGNMHRPRMLGVPGEDLPHVSHYFEGPHKYFRKRVLIVGGKNSAVEAALRCWRVGAEVTMSYRGAGLDPVRVKYWLRPEIEWLIQRERIRWLPQTVPIEITERGAVLEEMAKAPDRQSAKSEVEADFVLLLTGYVQDSSLFEMLGVELTGRVRRPVYDDETMETSVPGVYVAGTAAGGTQERAKFFIENTHVHAERIVRAVVGRGAVHEPVYGELEES